MTGITVGVAIATVRHVGYMEQHPGPQEAAGLAAGEAAAAAERPGATVCGYVRTNDQVQCRRCSNLTLAFVF